MSAFRILQKLQEKQAFPHRLFIAFSIYACYIKSGKKIRITMKKSLQEKSA